jgi:glycosyltransferase involved in cell wall biosynthesis
LPRSTEPSGTSHRPKVLHILESTSAGSARYVADVLNNLSTDRFEIAFAFSMERSDQRFRDDLSKLRARGLRLYEVPMKRSISPAKDLSALRGLTRVVREFRPDVVHAHSSKAGFLGRVATKLARPGAKTLYSPHAIAISLDPKYWYLEKVAGFFTDAIVGVSLSERDQLSAYGLVPQSKLRYVTAAIDFNAFDEYESDRFSVRASLGASMDEILIGSAGRLTLQKDPETFLNAAAILVNAGLPVRFVWSGDGELREQVEAQAKRLGLERHLILTGYVPDLRPILNALDIFVLTSLYESFGYVTCEAMALGKPVVGTDVPGTRELIENGANGWLVNAQNPEALAQHLSSMIRDRALLEKFGRAGKERVKDLYNLPRMISDMERLYADLLGLKPSNSVEGSLIGAMTS